MCVCGPLRPSTMQILFSINFSFQQRPKEWCCSLDCLLFQMLQFFSPNLCPSDGGHTDRRKGRRDVHRQTTTFVTNLSINNWPESVFQAVAVSLCMCVLCTVVQFLESLFCAARKLLVLVPNFVRTGAFFFLLGSTLATQILSPVELFCVDGSV